MRTIFEIAHDCAGQALALIGYRAPVEGEPSLELKSEELLSISPIIAAMITATIAREQIDILRQMFEAEHGKGYNGG